eukprot:CAMPEP_0202062452 /NCGR_PEP_ID=MMETSP0963-20130614/43910_1 /ASSEMBLY_ACC=CAM_ASM_000494 /TAXON_ID=4773 /ORGANISM="Schizochytrium aggregatum, Strain ATCC28209" /LENGTH=35 /DNA_ID= /DNA_START= /DNA_END= /DNA_ORIENTATION=
MAGGCDETRELWRRVATTRESYGGEQALAVELPDM